MQDHVFLAELDGFFEMVTVELLTRLPGDANRDQRMAAAFAEFTSLFEGQRRDAAAKFFAEETRPEKLRYRTFFRDWTGGDR
jgi:hypothetical protein